MSHHGATNELIAQVEDALRRIMDPTTPTPLKTQLETQLTEFKAHVPTCLAVLYQLLSSSTNEYALWFASTTMEEYVATRWRQFSVQEKQHLRQFVWEYVLAQGTSTTSGRPQHAFVLRKLRKVIADIARLEWLISSNGAVSPTTASALWPDFLSQVEAMVMETSTRRTGLEILCVVAEEFGREDALVVATSKRRAKSQLTAQLPSLLALLSTILNGCNQQFQQESNPAVLQEQDGIAQLALETLTHLLSWAPVAEAMHDGWIPLLFELSASWQHVRQRGGNVGPHLCGSSLVAMQVLIELMSKRFQPGHTEAIVGQTMMGLCPLVQKTVEDNMMSVVTPEFLDKLTEFVEAFLTQHLKRLEHPQYEPILPQFLELVMRLTTRQPHVSGFLNCLSVWEVFVGYIEEAEQNEAASNEHVRQLLASYERGLISVMFHLLDRVNFATNEAQLTELGDDDDEESAAKANDEAGTSFDVDGDIGDGRYVTGSLQDLAQWWASRSNSSDGAGVSVNVELSDWKEFVVECIALIRRIAAFQSCAPPLLERIFQRVKETCENLVFRLHETPSLPPGSDAWTQERYTIRDLTVNCAILSSVCAQHYCVSQDVNDQTAGWQILHMFIQLSEYLTQNRLHTRGDAFVGLQCESLTCIRFCLTCVPYVMQSGARDDVLKSTESVLQVLLQTLDTTIISSPQIVMQNAMQLLANLGYVLPYDDMISLPSMVQLEANIHQFSQHLPLTIQGDLYTSMSNSILNSAISLRNSGATNEEAMQRWANAYGALILPIRESIDQSAIAVQQNEHRVLEQIMITQFQRDFYLVRCLARSVELKPKIAKDGFCSAYQQSFPSILSLMTTYFATIKKTALGNSGSSPRARSQVKNALKVVNEIVRLYAQMLKSIRKEMQKETVGEIMRTFVEIFGDAQLSSILRQRGTPGLMVLCGFLQLLKIVVEEPTSVFSSFLQSVLELCYGPLKEAIFDHPESETIILGYFVSLVEQILEKHYRFFVSAVMTPDGRRERQFSSDAAHSYFVSIFQSLAAILTREGAQGGSEREALSPRLCRQVLTLLDRIDNAHKAFTFNGFKDEIRLGFLSTLMNILTKGEMNLLQDEIIALIHRLAAVDFQSFYQVFLPTYQNNMLTPQNIDVARSFGEGTCLQWSGQVDLPTFTQEVHSYLNDLRVIKAQAT
ncbi:hypothetical protein Poli38472_004995 [Pythium oligandrum]|uniref:Importin N-terminal domain-containing protein n=1 Tax=Pythium oligandrum TaxID=41045 RepID=A0A8K1FEX6_PYTOL|nr:hypothetical protein Poli38472_004995 [Pythium oligandrum]|eukprot:TMW59926.1 hypothetical protein Poli38472_004995 [Pythium oligandrum]